MKFYIDFDHTLYKTNELIYSMIDSVSEYILQNGNFDNYTSNFKKEFPNLVAPIIERNIESISKVLKDNFKRPEESYLGIKYNIYSLINTFAILFECNANKMTDIVDSILDNGEKFLYEDSVEFLRLLKANNNEVYILSHEKNDLNYQNRKITATKLLQNGLVDAVIVTRVSKATLTIDNYNNKDITSVTTAFKSINSKASNIIDSASNLNLTGSKIAQNQVDYEHGIFFDDRISDLEALYESAYAKELPNIKSIRIFRVVRPYGAYRNKSFTSEKYNLGIKTIISPLEALSTLNY